MNDSFHITSTQPEVATVPCTAGCHEVMSTIANMVNSQGIDKTTVLNLCLPICYLSIVLHNECAQLCMHMLVCEYWNGTLCVNIDNRGGGWIGNARVRICTSATESATRTRPQHLLAAIANERVLATYLWLPALPFCRVSELRRLLIQPQLSGCQNISEFCHKHYYFE